MRIKELREIEEALPMKYTVFCEGFAMYNSLTTYDKYDK